MRKSNNKIKILAALSGGVDSAVAAAILVNQGYSVTGAYMVNYDNNKKGSESCWLPDYRDALRVGAHLGIKVVKLNFAKEYKESVLDYMFSEYKKGRTPNPDVLCNKFIKFGVWLNKARELGFDYLATGHYARREPGISNIKYQISNKIQTKKFKLPNIKLFSAKDLNKDQTYFLHQLSQTQLMSTIFPIGDYTKPEVRKLAAKFKLPVAEKEESMGICFIGEVPMKEFLEQKIIQKPGDIVMSDGAGIDSNRSLQPIGRHDGLSFYTIGQRHLAIKGVAFGYPLEGVAPTRTAVRGVLADNRPLYVLAKNSKTNELVVGRENDPLLYIKEIVVSDVNWISGQEPKFPLKCEVRLRHRQPLQSATVTGYPLEGVAPTRTAVVTPSPQRRGQGVKPRGVHAPLRGEVSLVVAFSKPQRAVTPGQFAVFYRALRSSAKGDKKGECLGGGVIN